MSTSSTDSRKKGAMGDGVPDMLHSTTSSPSSSSVAEVGTLPKMFRSNGQVLLTIGLHLIWLKVIIFHLGATLCYEFHTV